MAYTVRPDDDVVSLPPTEWKDLTEAEDALSKLARVANGGAAQSKSFADTESGGPLADATLFVEAKPPRRRVARTILSYLIAAGFGVAGTLAWQRHGEQVEQTLARWVPQHVWLDSPAIRALAPASAPAAHQAMAAEPAVAEQVTPPAPPVPPVVSSAVAAASVAAPSVAAPAVTAPAVAPPPSAAASELADLRKTVERMAATQEQMAREISTLRAVRPEARPKFTPPPTVPQSVAVLPPPAPPP